MGEDHGTSPQLPPGLSISKRLKMLLDLFPWQSASRGCARCLIQLLQHPPRRLTALPGGVWGASEIDFGVTQAAVGNIDSAGSQLLTLVSLHSISQGNPVPMV